MEQTRREALKKGALGGVLLWAAPAVATVGRAYAAGSNPPATCVCTSDGFALSAAGNIGGVVVATGEVRNAATVAVVPVLSASVLTTSFDEGACSAATQVTGLTVTGVGLLVSATVLKSSVGAPCDCRGTASADIATLVVNGVNLLAGVTVSSTPNNVLLNAGGIRVVVNEQVCDGNVGIVRALHLTATIPPPVGIGPGISLDLIVAESRAGNDICPCPLP